MNKMVPYITTWYRGLNGTTARYYKALHNTKKHYYTFLINTTTTDYPSPSNIQSVSHLLCWLPSPSVGTMAPPSCFHL